MNKPPPLPGDHYKDDAKHLKLLWVFHFIAGGLSFIAILGVIANYIFLESFMTGGGMAEFNKQQLQQLHVDEATADQMNKSQAAALAQALQFSRPFYMVIGVLFAGAGLLNATSGYFIRARKYRTFSIIVAAINCVQMPIGTALGIFTLIVLLNDSVRDLYAKQISS